MKRSVIDTCKGYYLLSHPLPILFHTIAVLLFLLIAAWAQLNWFILLMATLAHFSMQFSISALNDYCDQKLDRLSKPHKPIVSGLISARAALVAGLVATLLMVLFLFPLPRLALLVSLCYLALGQGYNLGLKSTPWSGLVFAVAMPLIPVYAFVSIGNLQPFLWWLIPVGALLGIALNLANSLPDIQTDAVSGAHTLAVVLGEQRTLWACPLLILLATGLIALITLTGIIIASPLVLLIVFVVTVLLCCVLFGIAVQPQPSIFYKGFFFLVVTVCLLLVVGWLGALFFS